MWTSLNTTIMLPSQWISLYLYMEGGQDEWMWGGRGKISIERRMSRFDGTGDGFMLFHCDIY